MTDPQGSGRADVELRLQHKAQEDDSFRQQLLQDPKRALEQELGTSLPDGVNVKAVEETADTIYLVIPSQSQKAAGSAELSDADLDAVAGGGSSWSTCGQELTCWCVTTTECHSNATTVYGSGCS
jgi:hypothetical protein